MKKQPQLKIKILKMEMLPWKNLEPFQPEKCKNMTLEEMQKLKKSFLDNDVIQVFNVWEEGNRVWVMDGHHRIKALYELEEEGIKVPEKFPCAFVDFKTRKEAANSPLVYSSHYSQYTTEGLVEFIKSENLDFDLVKESVNFPNLDMDYIDHNFFNKIEPAELSYEEPITPKEDRKKRTKECPQCGFVW